MTAHVASAFLAGLATSIGPCIAPRYLALTALLANSRACGRWLRVVCFAGGLLLCYGLLATAVSLIAALAVLSRFIYLGLALGFLGFGLRTLTASPACAHARSAGTSPGAAFMAGGALGLVFSPCCTPVVGVIAGIAATSGSFSAALPAAFAFALGHLAPLATVGAGFRVGERFAFGNALGAAMGTIGGGLSVALACYYGILA